MSEGFAVSLSMMAPIRPNEPSFSKAAFAVSLGSGWGKGLPSDPAYEPRVSLCG